MKIITEGAFYYGRAGLRVVLLSLCIIVFHSATTVALSQKATRQTAMAAYDKGDFEQALTQFLQLSVTYPKDPLYKYYCGVCLVRIERDPFKASALLKEAITGSVAIRTVPADGLFWLGRAQQMTGEFTRAIDSYNQFTAQAGKKVAKEMNVPELIKQSQENKGMLAGTVEAADERKPVPGQPAPAAVSVTKEKARVIEAPSSEYDRLMTEALEFQVRSDSLGLLATELKKDLASAEAASKNSIRARIQVLEKLALESRGLADARMREAQKPAGSVPVTDTVKTETAVYLNPAITDTVPEVPVIPAAAIEIASVNNPAKDTAAVAQVVAEPQGEEIYSEFSIIEKPVYKPDEKVTINPAVPPGLVYRLQVAVFRNPVAPSYFKGISPVHGFRNEATGITTYYAGMFRLSADALKALTRVRALGFKDSFVAAMMDKKAVSQERSAMLEKEWGKKPLYVKKPVVADTTPQTLVFRVEMKRSPKPLPADQVENMKKMTGTRGFDIIVTDKKQSIYLAGKFLTFKSASEFADLLVRNGYRDSKVVAYLGNREIPVETARQLFDEK